MEPPPEDSSPEHFSSPKPVITGDGSYTIYLDHLNEHYHSIHGAITESKHVYIKNGLERVLATKYRVSILEVGFGTGLNALLTALYVKGNINQFIHYTTLEPYPLHQDIIGRLNYPGNKPESDLFAQLHEGKWEDDLPVTSNFILHKANCELLKYSSDRIFDLVYFDAFAPDKQPELWTRQVFERLAARMVPGGVLVTYCAQGAFRRNLKQAGFQVSALPGPPGKREMTFAVRKKEIAKILS